jgi:WD40 repeat protein
MRTHPEVINTIVRRDEDFEDTGQNRLGGSAYSSGVFRERTTGDLWLGKAEMLGEYGCNNEFTLSEPKTEGLACQEKIATDIYAYYGAKVPQVELSRQHLINTGMSEDVQYFAIHAMVKIIDGFQTYKKNHERRKAADESLGDFDPTHPLDEQGRLHLADGRILPERGLGTILAIATFIHDVDVIGSGANIGFKIQRDEQGQEYIQTIKIDPGEAFNKHSAIRHPMRMMRIALQAAPNRIELEILPTSVQHEFLMTLHTITQTETTTIRGFFTRRGGHNFTLYHDRPDEDFIQQLTSRQRQLKRAYARELSDTLVAYQTLEQTSRQAADVEDLTRHMEDATIQSQLHFYIPLDVETEEQREPLKNIIDNFLNPETEARALLLQGESGAGKTLALLDLEQKLLQARREDPTQPMPILIELKHFDGESVKDCVATTIREKYHLQITELRQRPVVLLLDGYDEISNNTRENPYRTQALHQWHNLKLIFTCRNRDLIGEYKYWFMPYDEEGSRAELLQDYKIAPFTEEQINTYIEIYAQRLDAPYTFAEYQQHLQALPNLGQLINNPFILRILVESLPQLLIDHQEGQAITQQAIYQSFMLYWFVKHERRLRENVGISTSGDLLAAFKNFSTQLAFEMHKRDKVEVTYQSSSRDTQTWERFFTDQDEETVQARSGCPLRRIGDRYSFVHKSFLEYFAARYMVDAFTNRSAHEHTHIEPKDIVKSPAVVEFLQSIFKADPTLKARLFDYINSSKEDSSAASIAANAITLLTVIKIPFSGMDLRKIKIPYAILDGGIFYKTDLRYADLRYTSMIKICLTEAKLNKAKMEGVIFDEYPFLKVEGSIETMTYSPDGKLMAIGTSDGHIQLWDTEQAEKITTLEGHTDKVTTIVFSPDGERFASGSKDKTVRIWNLNRPYRCTDILPGFDGGEGPNQGTITANQVAFTANGEKILYSDKVYSHSDEDHHQIKIHTYSFKTGEDNINLLDTFTGRPATVFSPDRQIVAIVMHDLVYVYDNKTHQRIKVLGPELEEEHDNPPAEDLAFSPDSKKIAAARFYGCFVQVWDIENNYASTKIYGHKGPVLSVAFGSDGKQLASGSIDKTVRIYDCENDYLCIKILEGFAQFVRHIIFNPDGEKIAAAEDKDDYKNPISIVRIWGTMKNYGTIDTYFKERHSSNVTSIVFSPDGKIVATGSSDATVRIWDVENNFRCIKTLNVMRQVNCINISDGGRLLAAGGRSGVVYIWDIEMDYAHIRTWCVPGGTIFKLAFHYEFDEPREGGLYELQSRAPGYFIHSGEQIWVDCLKIWSMDRKTRFCYPPSDPKYSVRCLVSQCESSMELAPNKNLSPRGDWKITVGDGFAVLAWKIQQIEGEQEISLHWRSHPLLECEKLNIENVVGLSANKIKLLKQRKAIGEPAEAIPIPSSRTPRSVTFFAPPRTQPAEPEPQSSGRCTVM